MAAERKAIPWPFAGRDDAAAHADQPQLTTRSARNVRSRRDDGRFAGGTRRGMSKWNETLLGSTRVKALCSTAIDSRRFAFSFTSNGTDELWSTATPSKKDSLGGVTDAQGNVFALDGNASIVKYNSAGREVLRIALPVADPNHVVRALWVDEANRVFAGVSAGGDVRTARVWCFLQLSDSEPFLLWTLEPGAYTEALRVHRGTLLYAAHNYTLENRGRVVVYEQIGLEPREASRIEDGIAYPIHDMDLLDGAVYTTSGDNLGDASSGSSGPSGIQQYRPGHPAMRGFHAPVQSWTPWMLDGAHFRIWSWYDAHDPECLDEGDLEQTGDVATMEEGQQVLRWRDKSGNNRHWYAGTNGADGSEGPTLSKVGPGGLRAIRFTNVGSTKQALATLTNPSVSKTQADQQRTSIPAHEGAMWAMFMLIRPQVDDVDQTDPRVVWYAENDDSGIFTSLDHGLWVNRACGAVEPGTFSLGALSYHAKTDSVDDGGCATADQPVAAGYTNSASRFTDCALVTILWDGGIDPNDTTKTRCLVRVNGQPFDRFEGLSFKSLKANFLGFGPSVATAVANRLNGEVCEMLVVGRRDRFDDSTEPKVLTHDLVDFTDDFPAGQAQGDSELARIESYMMHRRGLGHLLGGAPGAANPGGLWPHFYGQDDSDGAGPLYGVSSPPDYDGAGRSTAFEQVLQRYPLVTKHNDIGRLVWVCNEETHADTGADRGGIGYGVRVRKVESDGLVHVYLAGPDATQATTGDVAVRKIIDEGDTFGDAQADGAWRHVFSGSADFDYEFPRMAVDKFGNLFVPGYNTSGGGTMRALTILQKDPDGSGDAVVLAEHLLTSPADLVFGVALPPDAKTPDYRGELATEVAERCYLFTTAGDGVLEPADSVFAIEVVHTAATASGNPVEVVTLAVVEDDIQVVTATTNTVPTGGSAVIDNASQFVQAIRAGEDIVVSDGKRLLVYNLREGTVEELQAEGSGEIPFGGRASYMMYWRHRLFLAFEGGKYAASRLGNIRDWNLNPGTNIAGVPLQTATQAFTGTLTRAGEAQDSIATMIPGLDDVCWLVGHGRILRLTGDPQDNGQIHLVTESMGGVPGNSWCIDDRGRAYMWGNAPPGLYHLPINGDPEPLSKNSLEASEFLDIDYSTHRIELAWDPIERCVRIYQIAWSASTLVNHWAWESETHRLVNRPPIWQDRIGATGKQPTAITYLGGETSRGLLLGCQDGYIRRYDTAARDDDGTPIDSLCVMELTSGWPTALAARLTGLEVVLADDLEGCVLELFASETADSIGPVRASFPLKPGLNVVRTRLKGGHLFARLRWATTGRWGFEEMAATLQPAGRIRPVAT